ncbi:unnamed protein product [Durusdinium trenchii]|uniref:Pentatricopeptide repeat-containing protein, chloroplastic n=1 Tax=Durusdinium trenchii TaxID=1381693 RepID=A0ABP0IS15_9DINO
MRRKGSGLCLIYGQKQCMLMIEDWEAKRGRPYERIIFSRPDFHWIAPHIPLSYLSTEHIWVMDGEDNGGLNDRHWIFPRHLMRVVLGAWDHIVDGFVVWMHQAAQVLPWWGAETFFGLRLMQLGYHELIRRLPVPAFLECSNRYSRKEVDTSAVSVNDTARLSESKLRCHLGGPKYRHEHHQAEKLAACFGDHEQWSWALIWVCWCEVKFRRGMLQFLDYELCDSTLREVYSTAADRTVEEAPAGEKLNGTTTGPLGQTRAECQEILIGVAREERRMGVERLFLVTFGRANLAPEELALGMEHAGGSQWGNLGGKACGVGEATRRRNPSRTLGWLAKASQWQDALKLFLAQVQQTPLVLDLAACSAFISSSSKRSAWLVALQAFEVIGRAAVRVDEMAYCSSITALERGSQWEAALEQLNNMHAGRLQRNVFAYGAAVAAVPHWPLALELLRGMQAEMILPSTVVINAAIACCETAGEWSPALALLELMLSEELEPSVITLGSTVAACGRGQQLSKAFSTWHFFESLALRPSTAAWASLCVACERGQGWQEALEVVEQAGLRNAIMLSSVMNACVGAQEWQRALVLLDQAVLGEVALDSVVHLAEIHAWEAGSHWATAVALLHGAGRSPPNMICRSAAMSACERESQWQSAVAILKCMMDDGLQPDVVAYSTATSACEKAWQWQRALLLVFDMEERSIPLNTFSYNAAISACAAGRALELAVDLFSTMCSKRVSPDVVSYSAMITCCEKSHDWRLAVDFLQSMFAQDLQPNIVPRGVPERLPGVGRIHRVIEGAMDRGRSTVGSHRWKYPLNELEGF